MALATMRRALREQLVVGAGLDDAARLHDQDEVGGREVAVEKQMPDDLVRRVVPADVFAHHNRVAVQVGAGQRGAGAGSEELREGAHRILVKVS